MNGLGCIEKEYLKRLFGWVLLLVLGFGLWGCGYRFAGGGEFPGAIKSVSVDILTNRTAETGIENIITNDLIYEITRRKKVILTTGERADAILSGDIRSLVIDTISHRGTLASLERRVTVSVNLKLVTPDGETIWSATGVSANEEYAVSSDKLATEQNRRNAIETLSKRLAQNVYYRLTDNF